jgi:hypothetical protein
MMTINEFRKLNRRQLTEMLVEQAKQIESLKEQLKAAEERMEERDIKLSDAGNIATAALQLNHIFEDAQAACEQYVYSVKTLYAREHEICRLMQERLINGETVDFSDLPEMPNLEEMPQIVKEQISSEKDKDTA